MIPGFLTNTSHSITAVTSRKVERGRKDAQRLLHRF